MKFLNLNMFMANISTILHIRLVAFCLVCLSRHLIFVVENPSASLLPQHPRWSWFQNVICWETWLVTLKKTECLRTCDGLQRILYSFPWTALNDFESRYGNSGSGWATTLELSHRNHWLLYPIVLSYLGWTMGQWRNRNEKVLQRKQPVPQQHVMRAFQH